MTNPLGDFIKSEVERAETDFKSVRDRGLSIVSVTGTIVGLVSGLLAIAAGSKKDILPGDDVWILGAALVAFVIAAILALLILRPSDVTASDPEALAGFVETDWEDEGWDKQVSSLYADYLQSLRAANAQSATFLLFAVVAEIVGIALIAVTSVVILRAI